MFDAFMYALCRGLVALISVFVELFGRILPKKDILCIPLKLGVIGGLK